MPKLYFYSLLVGLSVFPVFLFINGNWGWGLIDILLIFVIFGFKIASMMSNSNTQKNQHISENIESVFSETIIENIEIPLTCPNCKSPNSKKIRICEWCGNQIV